MLSLHERMLPTSAGGDGTRDLLVSSRTAHPPEPPRPAFSGFEEEKCIYKGSLLFGGEVLNISSSVIKKIYHYFHEFEARVKK